MVYSSWNSSEVRMKIMSTLGLVKTSWAFVVNFAMWNFSEQCFAFC